jgi:hypothetical protein
VLANAVFGIGDGLAKRLIPHQIVKIVHDVWAYRVFAKAFVEAVFTSDIGVLVFESHRPLLLSLK